MSASFLSLTMFTFGHSKMTIYFLSIDFSGEQTSTITWNCEIIHKRKDHNNIKLNWRLSHDNSKQHYKLFFCHIKISVYLLVLKGSEVLSSSFCLTSSLSAETTQVTLTLAKLHTAQFIQSIIMSFPDTVDPSLRFSCWRALALLQSQS